MTRLCTICARGGSKGVKDKNIRSIHGRPLIAYSIMIARESALFDFIAVSSDSPEILAAASAAGADILVERPDELASDSAPKVPAIAHCVEMVENRTHSTFSTLVDLDATSPLRSVADVIGAVTLLETTGCSNVVTACPARRSPYFNLLEQDENGFARLAKNTNPPITRRQDAPPCFDMNASIYVWRSDAFKCEPKLFYSDTRIFLMPEERSVDIDSDFDFEIVDFIFAKRKK